MILQRKRKTANILVCSGYVRSTPPLNLPLPSDIESHNRKTTDRRRKMLMFRKLQSLGLVHTERLRHRHRNRRYIDRQNLTGKMGMQPILPITVLIKTIKGAAYLTGFIYWL